MLLPFEPAPRDVAGDAYLGEIPSGEISDPLFFACELVERYVTDLALDIGHRLDLAPHLAEGIGVDELIDRLGLARRERAAIVWLLDRLAEKGELEVERDGGDGRDGGDRGDGESRYRAKGGLRAAELADLRAIGLELDRGIAPTLALLDAAAEAFPAVVAGRVTGEQALFSGARMQLWLDYFHNGNSIYALNNRFAAIAAANRLPDRGGLKILEVGAGAGSAAEALLDELERRGRLDRVAEYRLTEPNAFLRRRAARTLASRFPGIALVDQAFDLDLPAEAQGLSAGSFDLVLAVNVLHIARDLRAALTGLRDLLRPGGWLVAGECLRLLPGQTIAIELVFQQLRSFTEVELDGELRPGHGFLKPENWRRAFAAAGFEDFVVVPELERIRDHYERFFTGAICGRRPADPS